MRDLFGTVIGGHIGLAPKLQRLIRENLIIGYNMPQGVAARIFRFETWISGPFLWMKRPSIRQSTECSWIYNRS
jgi:hypothetical protein